MRAFVAVTSKRKAHEMCGWQIKVSQSWGVTIRRKRPPKFGSCWCLGIRVRWLGMVVGVKSAMLNVVVFFIHGSEIGDNGPQNGNGVNQGSSAGLFYHWVTMTAIARSKGEGELLSEQVTWIGGMISSETTNRTKARLAFEYWGAWGVVGLRCNLVQTCCNLEVHPAI